MIIKGITDEDFINYKVPSMFIASATCSFKCDREYGSPICQNSSLAQQPSIEISVEQILRRYYDNQITHAIVFGGLEPMDDLDDLISLIRTMRADGCMDDVVIYTGYTRDELYECGLLDRLLPFENIVIKFGRYIPGQNPHLDTTLGVMLASDNQYAERIS